MEIRTVGQQYTVLIDGELINQFDNSVPKIASRNGDPPTMARQLAEGYLGLQTHGGNDRISYREIQVKDLSPTRSRSTSSPRRWAAPGCVGLPLTCARGDVGEHAGRRFLGDLVPLEPGSGRSIRASALRASSTWATSRPRPSPSSAPRT